MLDGVRRWLSVGRRVELLWLGFAVACLAAMVWMIAARALSDWETVPFHFVYVSFTLLYGYRAWRLRGTLVGMAFVIVSTGVLTLWATVVGWEATPEVTEIPLMALMFAAMVFHVRRRQQATAVAEALAAARAADLARQRVFVSDASHELLTPITIARGHMDLLRRERRPEPDDIAEAVSVVTGELDRMARLIDRLLTIERAASLLPDDRAPVDVRSLLTELHQRWEGAADRHWELGPVAGGLITADLDQLMLALDAIVENAVQHTGPGDVIAISSRAAGARIEIHIRDSGTGIPAYARGRVFDRFYRVDQSRNRRLGGSGLGLWWAGAAAPAHGGDVRAETAAGGGAEFVVTLPRLRSAEAQPVAATPADRLDGDVGRELPPQPADRHVDDVRARVELIVPDGAQDPLP
jgi:signal transduction histidine kinase